MRTNTFLPVDADDQAYEERTFVMPVNPLPPHPNLAHLKSQARDLLKARTAHEPQAAQRIREFHPRFQECTDATIFDARFRLGDAQLTIARERGFASWARLKRHIEKPTVADNLDLPHHERIENRAFRHAVDLLDQGDVVNLRAYLNTHPHLVREHVIFEGGNYFRHPTLLAFVAENPVRRGTLPDNIVEVARVILDAGAQEDQSALDEALGLVSTGCVPRECRVHLPLIDLLCAYGAEPTSALRAALAHGELEAADALLRNGARIDLGVAAGLGCSLDVQRFLPASTSEDRYRALALASQYGYADIVRLLLDAGCDPNRYNPIGLHAHATPLHQAAAWGHDQVVRLLVERGARPDIKDTTSGQGTPADWARHEGHTDIEEYLRARGAH
jgi:Ankyrin repeats (3 copies)